MTAGRRPAQTVSREGSLPSFQTLRGPFSWAPEFLLALDPGETTGWAIFQKGELHSSGQWATPDVPSLVPLLNGVAEAEKPPHVVCEDYRIYAHKLAEHTFSSVITLRLIGAITFMCAVMEWPLTFQMAYEAKTFIDDRKLEAWSMKVKGRHARDAVRHGAFYLTASKARRGQQRVQS